MEEKICLNCNTTLGDNVKFCQECGQSRNVHPFTMGNFFHEGFHAITHTDKGIFHLLKSLATKPGTTAREYIEGKRKRYFSPFTFFLILMTIFVLSNTYFLKERKVIEPSARVLQHISTEEGKKKYIATIVRVNNSQNFFRKHGNIVAMVAVPVIAFFTWLFFKRKKYNYAEHLTAIMMFVAFSNLVFTVVVFPLAGLLKPGLSASFTVIAILLQVIYFTWGINGFLQLTTTGLRTKSFFVCFLAIFSWSLLSITAMAVYVYQDWNFYEFFTRMKG